MSKLKKYLIATFTLCCIILIPGIHDHNLGTFTGNANFSTSLMLCMFTPTVGALIAGADFREMGWRLHSGRNKKWILLAWLLPTVFAVTGAFCYYLVFPEDFAPAVAFERMLGEEEFKEFQADGSHYLGYISMAFFESVTSFNTFVAIIFGLGEEIGWRGYMFKELKSWLGRTKGVLLGGVIHGAWHFPVMIFAGYEYGRDYYGAPLLGLFTFCIFTVSTGIISDWLYEKSGSIWLPAISHGLTNAAISGRMVLGNDHPRRVIFGPAEIGLIGVIPIALFAAGVLYWQHKEDRLEFEEAWELS